MRQTIEWHPKPGDTLRIYIDSEVGFDNAFERALVCAYRNGYVAPRWWEYWRWGEWRLVHPREFLQKGK